MGSSSWQLSSYIPFFKYSSFLSPIDFEDITEFLEEVIKSLTMDEEVRTFEEVMVPVFDILLGRIRELHLCQILLYSYLDILLYFTKQKDIAKVSPWLSHSPPDGQNLLLPLTFHLGERSLFSTSLWVGG